MASSEVSARNSVTNAVAGFRVELNAIYNRAAHYKKMPFRVTGEPSFRGTRGGCQTPSRLTARSPHLSPIQQHRSNAEDQSS